MEQNNDSVTCILCMIVLARHLIWFQKHAINLKSLHWYGVEMCSSLQPGGSTRIKQNLPRVNGLTSLYEHYYKRKDGSWLHSIRVMWARPGYDTEVGAVAEALPTQDLFYWGAGRGFDTGHALLTEGLPTQDLYRVWRGRSRIWYLTCSSSWNVAYTGSL